MSITIRTRFTVPNCWNSCFSFASVVSYEIRETRSVLYGSPLIFGSVFASNAAAAAASFSASAAAFADAFAARFSSFVFGAAGAGGRRRGGAVGQPASPSAAGSVDAAASPSGFTGGSSNCATNCATPVYGGIFRFSMGRLYGIGGRGANSARCSAGALGDGGAHGRGEQQTSPREGSERRALRSPRERASAATAASAAKPRAATAARSDLTCATPS